MNNIDLNRLIENNKELFRDYSTENISESLVVEKILLFSDIEEIKELIYILWKEKVKNIFKNLITKSDRIIFPPHLINYFTLVFWLEDEIPLWDIIKKAERNSFLHR